MKIIIAGGSGFLGENLEKYFTAKGNHVYILTRNPQRKNEIYWDAQTLGEWKTSLESADVLVNLTGNLWIAAIMRKINWKSILQESTAQEYYRKRWMNVLKSQKYG